MNPSHKTFLCSNCVENIKINLEQCHNDLKINRSLRPDESINWFFSYLKIYLNVDNIALFTRMLKYNKIDKKASAAM